MRCLVVLVAACGADPAPAATVPPRASPVEVPSVDAGVVAAGVPDWPIHALHGAPIAALALTEDGGAAITVDTLGATRLWPALDGSREPVVVAGVHPARLAIARAGERFAVAAIDATGALEILAVRASGAIAARAAITGRPIIAIVATPEGFVAQADDQAIVRFALDGAPRDRLVPSPGERIAGLVQRGSAVLALVAGERGLHGVWLGAGEWGAATPALAIDPAHTALSPDATRLAGRAGNRIAVVALATGRIVDTVPRRADDDAPIAFTDATHLAIAGEHTIRFWHGGELGDAGYDVPGEVAGGDGVVVWARGASLGITRPSGTKYLGYQLAVPRDVRAFERGFAIGDGTTLVRTDEHFATRAPYAIPDGLWNRIPLDAHHAFALARSATNEGDLVAVDVDTGAQTLLVEDVTPQIDYQPATHIYTAFSRGRVMVGRYVPRTHAFEGPIAIRLSHANDTSYLVPWLELPERGSLVSIVEPIGGGRATRTDIGAIDFAHGEVTIGALGTHALADEQAQVDPRPTRHGGLVAALAGTRVELRDATGIRWTVASHGVAQLVWTPGGELVGVGNGIARFDLGTGALAERRCGWAFRLAAATPTTFATNEGTLCDD